MKLLLTAGVDPNFFPEKSDPPIISAAYRGNNEVLRVLKTRIEGQKPVRFDVWNEEYKFTVLHQVLRKSQNTLGMGRPEEDK